jgi:hypothetical protein
MLESQAYFTLKGYTMTAEIVVMNREAVALAADSAVTINGGVKIFNTANKVFMLAPDCPVGILIFNNSTFMTLPWEIIIKAYKDNVVEREAKFSKLEEYGEDFISFLKTNHSRFSTAKQQELVINDVMSVLYNEITKQIWKRLEGVIYKTSAKITEAQVRKETKEEIERAKKFFENKKDIFSTDETKDLENHLLGDFKKIVEDARSRCFDKLPLDKEDIKTLNKLGLYLLTKDTISLLHSGVVFVGYGNDDLLPVCQCYNFEFLICEHLKYKIDDDRSQKIEFSGASAAILPFAQDDVAQNFIMGIHPIAINSMKRKLINDLSMKNKDAEKFLEEFGREMFESYTSSILSAVNSLPKEDLAIMAETLVNLTSFMRRVSMSLETVGGPVDVAVISKQDGFIWIKKKHYFDVLNNQHLSHN